MTDRKVPDVSLRHCPPDRLCPLRSSPAGSAGTHHESPGQTPAAKTRNTPQQPALVPCCQPCCKGQRMLFCNPDIKEPIRKHPCKSGKSGSIRHGCCNSDYCIILLCNITEYFGKNIGIAVLRALLFCLPVSMSNGTIP